MLKFFQDRHPDLEIVFEPVNKWQNFSDVDLLQKMFVDKKWALPFQLYSSLTRYENDFSRTSTSSRLMERSIYSERFVFLQTMYEMGGISKVEAALMQKWFDVMTANKDLKPDLILYLRCDSAKLKERITKRARPEEAKMDPTFLEMLQKNHDDYYFFKNATQKPPAKVLTLNGNLELNEFHDYLKRNENEILGGLRSKQ